jgi:putative ABC transport system permease protein
MDSGGRDRVTGSGGRRRGRLFERPVREDVRRELDSHLAMKVEELVTRGWSPAAALSEAERLFGDAAAIETECSAIAARQRRSLLLARWFETVLQDVRQGIRVLGRQRAFTVAAILTLGLGIGANVAVFSVIDSLLLAPLPYDDPSRLVTLTELNEQGVTIPVAEPNYMDWRSLSTSFVELSAYRGPFATPVLGGEAPVRRSVSIVTGEFFDVMRARALVGRIPEASEILAGDAGIAVVSESFWQSVLGGVRDLGSLSIEMGGYPFPVSAVLPAGFDFPSGTDVWVVQYPSAGGTRTSHNYEVVARLADGVTLEAAQSEMAAIGGRLAEEYAGSIDAVTVGVTRLSEALYGSYRTPLLLLLGASAIVLLVACSNLASAVLARSVVRRREVAVRASLGASRPRLVRQLLTENLLLSLVGGAAGLGLAFAVLVVLRAAAPAQVLGLRETSLSLPLLMFTLLLSVVAALLFGLAPALRSDDRSAATLLRGGDRGGTGRRGTVWSALVAAEVGLAFVLLVAAGLLIRNFREVISVDPGFDSNDVVTVNLYVPQSMYPDDTALIGLHASLVPALERVPGVTRVGIVSHLPMTGGVNGGVDIEGEALMAYGEYRVADAGYFGAMRIPLVRGRLFDESDRQGATEVAVVDAAFARQYFGDTDPVGRRIRNLRNDSFVYGTDNWVTIIGVVGAVRQRSYVQDVNPTVYVPASQRPWRARDGVLTLRTESGAGAVAAAIRSEVSRLAPQVPFEIGTARALAGRQLDDPRFAMLVIGGFGVIALALAAVGIHGVVAYSVERRRREMGVRIALGAVPHGVARRVVRDAMVPVVAGVVLGLVASLALRRFVESALVSVGPGDPLTLAGSIILLTGVALFACALPAVRVTRIDPISALRAE